jgi:predicted phosphodiesterase
MTMAEDSIKQTLACPRIGKRCEDLGEFDSPVLLFGGVYSNLEALEAVLTLAKDQLQIPPERVIHTGDVVAYCANPVQATDLLISSGFHCLMGNCEESIAMGSQDCGCGFPEDSACAEYSVNWYAHVMKEFRGHDRLAKWMQGLARRIEFSMCGRRFAVVHGSPAHISKFVWPSTPTEELLEDFALLPEDCDGVISGHSGIPFARLLPMRNDSRSVHREKLWLNAGVIGMPANDGTSRAWYAVLSPQNGDIEVAIRPLSFDADKAAAAIHATGNLNRGYADALTSGVWPSHDILPLEEQMATGVALSESTLLWRADKKRRQAAPIESSALSSPSMVVVALGLATAALVLVSSSMIRRNGLKKGLW